MKRLTLILALIFSVGTSLAYAQGIQQCYTTTGTNCIAVSPTNPLPVTSSGSGGTGDVNLTEIGGAIPSPTNPLWISPATGVTFPISGNVTANQGTANLTPWNVQLSGYSFRNINTNSDTVVTAASGVFAGILINTAGVGSNAIVYNDTSCSSTIIGNFNTTNQISLIINAAVSAGVCVTTSGGTPADITILYR